MRAISDSDIDYLRGFIDEHPLGFIGWGEHQIQLRYNRLQIDIQCDFLIEWPGGKARRQLPFNASLEVGHLLGKRLIKFECNDEGRLVLHASDAVRLVVIPDHQPNEHCVIRTDENDFVIF